MRRGFKVTPTLRKKINRLAKKVGCPLNWNRAPGVQWDTKDVACKFQDASNIIHDIAHYAVASRKDRNTIDFGLGAGPDSDVINSDEDIFIKFPENYRDTSIKEVEASALGIYWEKQLGLPWKRTADYHSWNYIEELEKMWKDRKISRRIKKVGI